MEPHALAALVEKHHPALEERLLCAVTTSEAGSVHGSPAFAAHVQEEAEARLALIDVAGICPLRSAGFLAAATVMALVLALAPAFFWQAYAEFGRRFFSAGLGSSSAHQRFAEVQPGEPVPALAGVPTVMISPPSYVNSKLHPRQTVTLAEDLAVLQFSSGKFYFGFNTATAGGDLEFRNIREPTRTARVPLSMSSNGMGADLELPALEPGAYALQLRLATPGKTDVRHELPKLVVWRDEPPSIAPPARAPGIMVSEARQGWLEESSFDAALSTKAVPPDDRIRLSGLAKDKVGMASVGIEYRINGGPIRLESVVTGYGQRDLSFDHVFRLQGKVKDGDVVAYRIKASDNRQMKKGSSRDAHGRQVPEVDLLPQHAYEPAARDGTDRWLLLTVDSSVKPLFEQLIQAQHRPVHERLEHIRVALERVREETRKAGALLQKTGGDAEVVGRLNSIVNGVRTLRDQAQLFAQDGLSQDWLRELAGRVGDLAFAEISRAEQALDQAVADPTSRKALLQKGERELSGALERLDELIRAHDRLTADRLDQMKLADLAARQGELAEDADARQGPADLAELANRQEKVAETLDVLTKKSRLMQDFHHADWARQAQELAEQTHQLAQAQREMANQSPKAGSGSAQEMQKKAEALTESLSQLARSAQSEKAGKEAHEAAMVARRGQEAMRQSHELMKKGQATGARKAGADAAKLLDEASAMLRLSGKRTRLEKNETAGKLAAAVRRNLRQGRDQAERAKLMLEQGKSKQAAMAMRQAGQALNEAALDTGRQLAPAQKAGPAGTANRFSPRWGAGVAPDPRLLGKDMEKYAGRPWGELPGELRNRLLQDMQARFGEDYAHVIRHYFERIALPK
jgi:hypothetical protein